ncbi:MAG: DUF4474 domain-containing protein [Treponema sp.]|uniref:DUF4474 domain-containing protein n=1 Tax=Treponema sp. TaxID=166 RepID=UPI0025CF7900|nr:DUF4474 domain-containing protein [Treponema sp.]MBQ8678971.1 DUF4474 domain-containing protein [Treponema sp.]
MAELGRFDAEHLIKKILIEYARKIRSAREKDYEGKLRQQLFTPRMAAFYKLVKSEDLVSYIFNRLNDEGIKELTELCQHLAKLYELDTAIAHNQVQNDNKFYSFHDGLFYIDARNTGVTISQIFEEVFPETNWEKDKEFYTDICRKCLGIDDPNKIRGEYRTNLQFDGNDETIEDNEFGKIMRQKYISDRFAENGKKGAASGRIILKEFDYKYGTEICKSENDNYAIQDRVYHELIPTNNLMIDLINLLGADILRILLVFYAKDIVSAMIALSLLYGLINPYIALLERKITTVTIPELKECAKNWIKYIKKFHLENIDDFEMNQGETIGFIQAVSVLVSYLPSDTNIITYNGCAGLEHNSLEEAAYRFYELGITGGCANLKNKFIDWILSKKETAKNRVIDAKKELQNNIIIAAVIDWIPDETKNNLAETFSIENITKVVDETAQKISESKSDLEKFEKTYIHKLMGFTYANRNDDYYFTEEGSLQSKMGFMDYYDDCGKYIGMDGLKDIVVTFPYEDKEYRVEFWYGPYGDGRSMGAEIGIYYRSLSDAMEREYEYKDDDSKFIFYDCVRDKDDKIKELEKQGKKYDESKIKSDQFVMTMDVFYDGVQLYSHKTEGHTGKQGNDDHFWCLAIRSSKLGQGDEKKENRKLMKINGTIEKKGNPKLMNVMAKALRQSNNINVNHEKDSAVIGVEFGG